MNLGTWISHIVLFNNDYYLLWSHVANENLAFVLMECRTSHKIIQWMSSLTKFIFVCMIFICSCCLHCGTQWISSSLYGILTCILQCDNTIYAWKLIVAHVFVSSLFDSWLGMTILGNFSQHGNSNLQRGRECLSDGKENIFAMAMSDAIFGIW